MSETDKIADAILPGPTPRNTQTPGSPDLSQSTEGDMFKSGMVFCASDANFQLQRRHDQAEEEEGPAGFYVADDTYRAHVAALSALSD
ncbi:hypothetical protein B0H14DRAFT_3439632 [Mycena olivaceomarginata]|nr:hypothetical protein B0H14DRAFT_3439632 [Mycena olivaceomarginata]